MFGTLLGALPRVDGLAPARAFLDGYHAGLTVTIALTAAGIVVAMIALRRAGTASVPAPAELAPEQAARLPERHTPDRPVSRETVSQAGS